MSKNVKESFETLAVAALCTMFVFSMHKSCSGIAEKLSGKKTEPSKVQKVQELKNDTIRNIKFEQKVR